MRIFRGDQKSARRQIRQEVRQQRKLLRSRLEKHPALAGARRRRKRRRWGLLLLVAAAIAALLLSRCSCRQSEPGLVQASPTPRPRPQALKSPTPRRPPLRHTLAPVSLAPKKPRQEFNPPVPDEVGWLADFRRQVSARSQRLRECFAEAERPGSLRWMAALHLEDGTVSGSRLEAVGNTLALTPEQEACLQAALSSPPYGLAPPDGGASGEGSVEVGLLLEF